MIAFWILLALTAGALGAVFHEAVLGALWWPIGKLIEWVSGGRGA